MNIARRERESHHLLKHFKLLCAAHPQHVERESRLLNPPPGSTDPERFATVSTGIGDRVFLAACR